ncbi:hypothetical protein BgiMline_003996 [Biomphalaria glabrata]
MASTSSSHVVHTNEKIYVEKDIDRTPPILTDTREQTFTKDVSAPTASPGQPAYAWDELYGVDETQVSPRGECDLHNLYSRCEKSPGHPDFIPFTSLNLRHLPEGHRNRHLYKLIKTVGGLTARVAVQMTSPDRPECWPGTNHAYPFFQQNLSTALRTGTGLVSKVDRFTDGANRYHGQHWKSLTNCWCSHCEKSDSPSSVWYEFELYTAAHLIFDDTEARCASLRLFHDRDDSPEVIVDRLVVDHADVDKDWCRLKCVTCDKSLGEKLERLRENFYVAWDRVNELYKGIRDVEKLTFIVSHPHGCFKHVSFGSWVNLVQKDDDELDRKFTYTTPTCLGSSGASVQCVGFSVWGWDQLVHSGSLLKPKLNYSGVGFLW